MSLAFLVSRHFATGVILATAFVHLLYESFVSIDLPSRCLDESLSALLASQCSSTRKSLQQQLLFGYVYARNCHRCIGDLVFEPIGAVLALAGTMFTFVIDFFSGRLLARQSKEATIKSNEQLPSTTEDKEIEPVQQETKQHAHRIPGLVDYSSKQAHFDVILLDAGIVFQ